MSAATTLAQESVGGNWFLYESEDPMTAAKDVRLEIQADNFLRESSYRKPKIEIVCQNGDYKHATFIPGTKLGPPNRPGFWWQPQQEVLVRIDNKHHRKGWNWMRDRSLAMDKGTVRDLLKAKLFRVEFNSGRGPEIAEFTPDGLNRDRVYKACGSELK